MSENVLRQAAQEASSDPAAEQSPTVTHYQQLAAPLSALVTDLIARIPRFENAHPLTEGFIRSNRNVPDNFIATVIAAVEAHPELQRLEKFDVAEAKDALQFLEAFRPLLIQIEALFRDLKFTMDARRAKVAADGLQTYDIAKGIVRDPSSAGIFAHVEKMRQDLGRTRPKHRDKTTPDPVPPGPVILAA